MSATIAGAEGAERMTLNVKVNGTARAIDVEPRDTLLDTLRDKLNLTGAKKGCEEAVCGSCAVLLNGRAVCSCMMFAVEAEGSEIVTIEGLSDGQVLNPIQKQFIEKDGAQCGFCTSGQIIASKSFLDHIATGPGDRIDDEIREAMSGNVCRCGSYNGIFDAIREVLLQRRQGGQVL